MNYSELAFTDAIKKIQLRLGSRLSFERMEKMNSVEGLTENETEFLLKLTASILRRSVKTVILIFSIVAGRKGLSA